MFPSLFQLPAAKQVRHSGRRRARADRRGVPLRLERLEDRTVPSGGLLGPKWVDEGPGPIDGLTVTLPPDHPHTGAINVALQDPKDGNTIYAATVNGGVWVTHNALGTSPDWKPLTDRFASLSISALAFDPLDSTDQTLYAGAGRLSSGGADGGPQNGLLKTTNGGLTWTHLGEATFSGQGITALAPTSIATPTGELVLAGTFLAPGADSAACGVYQSRDGGTTWTKMPATSGLPDGPVTNLIEDPLNSQRFYVSMPKHGVYRGMYDSAHGSLTWTSVNSDFETFSPGIVANSPWAIFLSIHNNPSTRTNVVYAAFKGNDDTLKGIFWSTDHGTSWSKVVDGPLTGKKVGALLADNINPDIFYVAQYGGDGVYLNDRFLSQEAQWQSMTGPDANGTTPHADARSMTFDLRGNILETSDGGIYKVWNPLNLLGGRKWQSLNGNIRDVELGSVAYDRLNGTVFGGSQDNGSAEQIAPGSYAWRAFGGQDGGFAAVDDTSIPGVAIHYKSDQALGYFTRHKVNSFNAVVGNESVSLHVDGTAGDLFFLDSTIQGDQPYVLNNVDPARMLIATNYLYESRDRGDHLQVVGGVTDLGGGKFAPKVSFGAVNSGNAGAPTFVYGGMFFGIPNPDLIYVGTNRGLFIRTSGTGLPRHDDSFTYGAVQGIAVNRNNWKQAVVLTSSGRVYRTDSAGGKWTDLTGNLGSQVNDPRAIEFYSDGVDDVILVGGQNGVYRTVNPDSHATWSRFGAGLANAVVRELHYYPVAAGAFTTPGDPVPVPHFWAGGDVLVAGTFGRGAWMISHASDYLTKPDPRTNPHFVMQLYQDLLLRPADHAGLAAWSTLLDQGLPRSQVALAFEGSREFHQDVVQNLFTHVLGRAADPTGLAGWTQFLDKGGTSTQLEALLFGSSEYFNHHGGSNDIWLQSLYQDLLHRPADPAGAQAWDRLLAQGTSREAVASAILHSPEAEQITIDGWYRQYLARPADTAGLRALTAALQQGMTPAQVLALILASDEYFGRG